MAKENDEDLTRVVFRMHAELDDVASQKAGRPIYNEYEACEISFPANKHTIHVAPATEYAGWGDDPITGQRTRITYAQKYNKQYLAFKAGTAQSLGGTPLEELTFLTQGKRLELKALNVHTAETLAALDSAQLKMLGMGGRELKDKATTYLEIANKNADASHLSAELAKRDAEMAQMREQIAALMQSGAPAPAPVVTPEVESAFKDFEDEDIGNWIKDADPNAAIDGLARDALIKVADDILAKQGKKQKKAA
jgi:hypothetical protein